MPATILWKIRCCRKAKRGPRAGRALDTEPKNRDGDRPHTQSFLPLERRYNHWGVTYVPARNLEFIFLSFIFMSPRSFRQPGISVENIKYPGSKFSDSIAYTNTSLVKNAKALFMYYLWKLVCGMGVDTESFTWSWKGKYKAVFISQYILYFTSKFYTTCFL